jgi:hypothetical protein
VRRILEFEFLSRRIASKQSMGGWRCGQRPTSPASAPKAPALAHTKLDSFSAERLMVFLNALAQDVEIVIRKKPRSRAAGRISVVAGR